MKKIRSRQDLALNGAAPAYPQPLHVGKPNVGDRGEFMRRVEQMFDGGWLTNNGPLVQEFESRVAAYLGVKECVAVCNGTVGLEIAIRALDLKGEVIIPSYTFIATAHALHWQDITPVFADIDPVTHNLSAAAVERMITPNTTGIIGVHLWGRGAPDRELAEVARRHRLTLMYDAAHAFGCSHGGRMIGGFGACEVLSFHATKFFNTFEGGAIVTNDEQLAQKMRLMRNFGFSGYDNVIHPGTNGKMIEIAAAMGLTNLARIDEVIAANRARYLEYRDRLQHIPGLSVLKYDESEHNNYQYVVVELGDAFHGASRDETVAALHAENILARKYFWPGCHAMKPYRDIYPHARLLLPETEKVAQRVIVMPTGPNLPPGVPDTIADVFAALAA